MVTTSLMAIGALLAPKAHSTDVSRGITIFLMSISRARNETGMEVAPPPVTRANSRGSTPRRIVMSRIPPIMFSLTTWVMPNAASSTLMPSGSAI
ncbi:hypothetical protein D9M73_271300 [compost metagenome]